MIYLLYCMYHFPSIVQVWFFAAAYSFRTIETDALKFFSSRLIPTARYFLYGLLLDCIELELNQYTNVLPLVEMEFLCKYFNINEILLRWETLKFIFRNELLLSLLSSFYFST